MIIKSLDIQLSSSQTSYFINTALCTQTKGSETHWLLVWVTPSPAVVWPTTHMYGLQGTVAIWGIPPKVILQFKFHEISFIHNILVRCTIVLEFCTEHGSIIAVLCTKFQNNWATEKSVTGKQVLSFCRDLGGISYIVTDVTTHGPNSNLPTPRSLMGMTTTTMTQFLRRLIPQHRCPEGNRSRYGWYLWFIRMTVGAQKKLFFSKVQAFIQSDIGEKDGGPLNADWQDRQGPDDRWVNPSI